MQRLACLLLILLTPAAQATTYRWVDEQGKVHYSDTLPPQSAGAANTELDKQGRVKKENLRTRLSPEERRRLEESRLRGEEAKREEEVRARRDRALLTTYVSESEIELARDRAVEREAANLRGLQTRLKAASEKLAYAGGQVDKYVRSGQSAPRTFLQMRDEARTEIAQLETRIREREQAIEHIKSKFEADKLRFRELTSALRR